MIFEHGCCIQHFVEVISDILSLLSSPRNIGGIGARRFITTFLKDVKLLQKAIIWMNLWPVYIKCYTVTYLETKQRYGRGFIMRRAAEALICIDSITEQDIQSQLLSSNAQCRV